MLKYAELGGISNPHRSIELDVDIGADARDWSNIQAQEKLKPIETDLRRIEEIVAEVVSEMEYLRAREQKLRDTNESTNERVKWFAFGTMGMLVGLGVWQVIYLRAYFRCVFSAANVVVCWQLTLFVPGLSILFSLLLASFYGRRQAPNVVSIPYDKHEVSLHLLRAPCAASDISWYTVQYL